MATISGSQLFCIQYYLKEKESVELFLETMFRVIPINRFNGCSFFLSQEEQVSIFIVLTDKKALNQLLTILESSPLMEVVEDHETQIETFKYSSVYEGLGSVSSFKLKPIGNKTVAPVLIKGYEMAKSKQPLIPEVTFDENPCMKCGKDTENFPFCPSCGKQAMQMKNSSLLILIILFGYNMLQVMDMTITVFSNGYTPLYGITMFSFFSGVLALLGLVFLKHYRKIGIYIILFVKITDFLVLLYLSRFSADAGNMLLAGVFSFTSVLIVFAAVMKDLPFMKWI